MANDVTESGRPQRGIIVLLECAEGDRHAAQTELLRRVTAMADYVLHVKDEAAGDEALDFLVQVSHGGGQQALRDVLIDLADLEAAGRRPDTERGPMTESKEAR